MSGGLSRSTGFRASEPSYDQPQQLHSPRRANFGAEEFFGGLSDAVFGPIAEDWRDAYHLQRAARVRYPGADAVLNVTPYLGLAAVADDIANDVAETGSVSGENLAEAALNRTAIVGYGKKALAAVKTVRKTLKEHFPRQADSAAWWTGALASVPVAAYAQHYVDKQKAANEKYGDRPLRDIAAEIKTQHTDREIYNGIREYVRSLFK